MTTSPKMDDKKKRARKRLEKSALLHGQTETITAMDFRAGPGDVLLQAQMGKVFNIMRHGVVIAVLRAPDRRDRARLRGS